MPRWLSRATLCGALVATSVSCAEDWIDPPPLGTTEFLDAHRQWRVERRALLSDPADSALSLAGLWPLKEGRTSFGSDRSSDVALDPQHAPPRAGSIVRSGNSFVLEPVTGTSLTLLSGETVSGPLQAATDQAGKATTVVLGSLWLSIHVEPGPSYWIRVRDASSPQLRTVQVTEVFEPDLRWRVAAKLERFRTPRLIQVDDVTGGSQPRESPGMLKFRIDGRVHRLIAVGTREAGSWRVPFKDATNRSSTYQAGRYLAVAPADASGWTVLDFNRAYNPPCAYSRYTVCMLPPPENRLPIPVTAGEKRPPQPVLNPG
jgi:uncharacterized protein (DUF1684 family)